MRDGELAILALANGLITNQEAREVVRDDLGYDSWAEEIADQRELTVYYDAEGNSGSLDEVLSE